MPKAFRRFLKKIPKKREVFIVAIDAGHGGEDPGAIGLNRTQEKKITLEISKKIMKLLESEVEPRTPAKGKAPRCSATLGSGVNKGSPCPYTPKQNGRCGYHKK